MNRAKSIAEDLPYTGYTDVMIDAGGRWISPAAEAYALGWKSGWLFVWSVDGYRYRRPL